ncbi:MAG: 50S ribosomal protein L24 [Clostridiales bacterium]|jgi:large subunit ribosomal protein L24|nr:50S ribosomal protein L24 [Clostridiales bacterium]
MKLKRNDNVKVIAGKDKGSTGRVLYIDRDKNRVVVEGVNMITKHQKPSRTNQRGGIIHKEALIHVSNLMYLHHNKPTRIAYKVEVIERDGVKQTLRQRVAVSTGEVID